MRNYINKFLALLLVCLSFVTSVPQVIFADTSEIVTLGANLSDEQRETVLSFFGLTEEDLGTKQVITVTNQDERKYLEGILSDSIIGTRTYSCAYIQPTLIGGINVRTANLTYVTKNTLYNALQTAGIQNCNLIVTSPFQVSGTGALTGVFMAFESTGTELDEDKKALASEELVETAELEKVYGESITDLVTDVKEEVIVSDKVLTTSEIEEIVDTKSKQYNIELKEEDTNKIVELTNKLQQLEYDLNSFTSQLKKTEVALEEASKETTGFFAKIKQFFANIVEWFKDLFNNKENVVEPNTESVETNEPSIFDNVNTDVFKFDDTKKDDVQSTEQVEEQQDISSTEQTDTEFVPSTEQINTEVVPSTEQNTESESSLNSNVDENAVGANSIKIEER